MTENNTHKSFISIFKNNLKKDARTVSIATLLSDRYLKRIKYDPYYQRNYVWERDKQSFFVESVFLGTEIPPLVFFKSGMNVEVIDGRQRFETLKRFKENDFALHISGLLDLQALAKKNFSALSSDMQQVFLSTKIRIFEFEVVGMPTLDPMLEDKIKKEIFRRYNSGITPLSQTEIDNAKYDSEKLSGFMREILKEDNVLFKALQQHFIKSTGKVEKELIVDMVTFLRKMLILDALPITRYAHSSGKAFILDLFYENFVEKLAESEDKGAVEHAVKELANQIKEVSLVLDFSNHFIYECLLWGIRILRKEGVNLNLEDVKDKIINHYQSNLAKYNTENDHYYGNIVARFQDTGLLLKDLTGFDFKLYLRNSDFKNKLKHITQNEADAEITLEKLSDLRINKPSPASKPIDQILRDVASNYYLIRPSYQRQEKISVRKASSIIESILLGIKLPPLFIYVSKEGVREVIDGQQRLLSIIGFLGRSYKNEDGMIVHCENHNFKLKDLRILTDYNKKKYSDLVSEVEDTILDFDIDEIEISEDLNEEFVPTELFIRLNSKPYPIKPNTFEMWNSTVDKDVIQSVKDLTNKYVNWFYIKSPEEEDSIVRRDRMQNEELMTILSYLCYNSYKGETFDKVLGFYPRLEKFTCRIKSKSSLTDILESFEFKPKEKERFLMAINKTEDIIKLIEEHLLSNVATKDSFNSILNLKKSNRFTRSNQEMYLLWMFLVDIKNEKIVGRNLELKEDIKEMLSILKNVDEKIVDQSYVENFHKELNTRILKYK